MNAPISLLRSPVDGDGYQREDWGRDAEHADELDDLAVGGAEGPVAVQEVDEVEGDVHQRHHAVGHGQVHQEEVGDGAHLTERREEQIEITRDDDRLPLPRRD